MMRLILILILFAGAGYAYGGPPPVPLDPGVEEALADPEWVEFLENLEMLDEYGDLMDVESPEPKTAKPADQRGVNTRGDGGDSNKE